MLVITFIALSLSACCAEIVTLEDTYIDNDVNEGSPCEVKIAAMLNQIKSETDARLSVIEKNIQQILERTNIKNNAIDAMSDKIERYMDRKFDLIMRLFLEESSSHKLIKTETKPETTAGPDCNVTQINTKYEALLNTNCDRFETNISHSLDTIHRDLKDYGNHWNHSHSDIDAKLRDLEGNITKKWESLEKAMKVVENVNSKCNNVSSAFESMLKNVGKLLRPEKLNLCKERTVEGYKYDPMFRLDNNSFNHVLLEKKSSEVKTFEMHIAVKGAHEALILLSPTLSTKESDPGYEIVLGEGGSNNVTSLRGAILVKGILSITTPNILSGTHYKFFTIRITEGQHLELVENTNEGEKTIISHTDANLRLSQYISFSSWYGRRASFRYDCPNWES